MARNLSSPRHPEIFGEMVAILRILAGERSAETSIETAIVAAMSGRQRTENAKRIIEALNSAPESDRTEKLGNIARADFRVDVAPAVAPSSFGQPDVVSGYGYHLNVGDVLDQIVVDRDELGGIESENSPSVPVYTIRYQGLFCQNETGQTNVGSDEIYVITSAVHVAADSTNVIRTERHPVQQGQRYYSGVDNNEQRIGPVAAVWQGTTDPVSLVVVVMEHDFGDPDKYKGDIAAIVEVAIELIKSKYGLDLSFLKDTVVDLVNWGLQTGDDIVTTEYKTLSNSELEDITLYSPGYYYNTPRNNVTNIMQHFTTSHSSSDANYIVCFDVLRNPSHEIERPPEG